MSKTVLTIEQVLELLANNPLQIAEFTAHMTPVQLHTAPNPGEWSANDVLAHLRSCADMWGNAMEAILTQDQPTMKAVNPRTWIEQTNYRNSGLIYWRAWKNYPGKAGHVLRSLLGRESLSNGPYSFMLTGLPPTNGHT
jgi:hypothetical protein